MSNLSPELHNGLQKMQAIAFDVDGVLTDGFLTWSTAHPEAETKSFHFSDIMGISLRAVSASSWP